MKVLVTGGTGMVGSHLIELLAKRGFETFGSFYHPTVDVKDINLSEITDSEQIELTADSRLDDEDFIHVGSLEFKVIHTPGHTSGSSALYCEKEGLLFSGDTIFRGTWGRTDVPTSSFEDLIDSITKKILVLPNDTIIYPGHGKSTKIEYEKPIYLELKPSLE